MPSTSPNGLLTRGRRRRRSLLWALTLVLVLPALVVPSPTGAPAATRNADDLLVVDCLLPGKVRKLGKRVTFMSARRAVKTSAGNCEIRGGEYTSSDRASFATALKIWLPLAKQGDPVAQTYVGEIYEKGLGVPPQHALAAKWYRQAAEQGYGRAQINLGQLYEQGRGVAQDMAQALSWYRRASGLAEFVPAGDVTRELEQLRQEVEQRRGESEALRRQLEEMRRDYERTREELRRQRNEAEQGRLERELARDELKEKLAQAEASKDQPEIARLERELRERDGDLARQRAELSVLNDEIASYEGEVERLHQQTAKLGEAQVDAEEMAALRREVARHKHEADALKTQLRLAQQQLEMSQAELEQRRDEIEKGRGELERVRAGLEAELKKAVAEKNDAQAERLRRRLAARDADLERRDGELKALDSEIAGYQGKVGGLERQIARLRESQADSEAVAARQRQEVAALQKEVARRTAEAEALKRQLQDAKQELGETRAELRRRQAEIGKSRRDLETVRADLQRQIAEAVADKNEAQAERLRVRLEAREAALERQRQAVAKLEQAVAASEQKAAELTEALSEIATAAGPSEVQTAEAPVIEIIDPPLTLTRGRPVINTRSAGERVIIGRVTSGVGLLSFIVNDAEQTVDENGLFRARVLVADGPTPVTVVAIDKLGMRTAIEFDLKPPAASAAAKTTEPASLTSISLPRELFGNYFALVIGNNDYTQLPKLKTAVADAREAARLLSEKYGFSTQLLLDATRYDILSALNRLREQLTENDNLLIYYGGHGDLDRVNQRGYWLPVDAEPGSSANWISNIAITDILNSMAARHVLVIADSCYSGAMTRSAMASLEAGMSHGARMEWVKLMADKRSRTVMTSGGLEPVLDSGGGDHSVFAKNLFEVLGENDGIIEAQRLYREVATRVSSAAAAVRMEQVPQYAPIQYAGHESGDFFFVPVATN